MKLSRERIGAIVGGVTVGALLLIFALVHEPAADRQTAAEQSGLNIPTVDQMCAGLGATDGDVLATCRNEENSAGEFVIAWMGYNGFITNGEIDIDQIQSVAEFDGTDALSPDALPADPTIDPSLGVDTPSDADPGADADPGTDIDQALSDETVLGGVTDPTTGETTPFFQSPAQLALFCLGQAVDWLSMHDCISINDPTSQIGTQ